MSIKNRCLEKTEGRCSCLSWQTEAAYPFLNNIYCLRMISLSNSGHRVRTSLPTITSSTTPLLRASINLDFPIACCYYT